MLCSVCSVVSSAFGSSPSPVACTSSCPTSPSTPARSSASVPPVFPGECSESSNVVWVLLVDRFGLQLAGALVGANSLHVGGGSSFRGDMSTFSTGALKGQVEGGRSVTTRLDKNKEEGKDEVLTCFHPGTQSSQGRSRTSLHDRLLPPSWDLGLCGIQARIWRSSLDCSPPPSAAQGWGSAAFQ